MSGAEPKKAIALAEEGLVVLVQNERGCACALCGSEDEAEGLIRDFEAWSGKEAKSRGDLMMLRNLRKGFGGEMALQGKQFMASDWGLGVPEGWLWIEGQADGVIGAASAERLARRILSERSGLGEAAKSASPRKRGPGL